MAQIISWWSLKARRQKKDWRKVTFLGIIYLHEPGHVSFCNPHHLLSNFNINIVDNDFFCDNEAETTTFSIIEYLFVPVGAWPAHGQAMFQKQGNTMSDWEVKNGGFSLRRTKGESKIRVMT